MTTETPPSVDECRECRAGRKQAAASVLGWWCPDHGEQAFRAAEAIRERDEAVALLREAVAWLESRPDYTEGDAATSSTIRAYLSRFLEAEGGAG